ncbi:MAG: ATP-binding protein [Saprospiraceae bacterium]|nr:ATP-binding protein [Saprospiraceae bacterium]HRF38317.1 ATP-binding protein [Saprospiraceae bacterium]
MLVGREKERGILERVLDSESSELVAVLGRRRVGKTFLIHSVFEGKIRFETSGVKNATLREQLGNFHFRLKLSFGEHAPSKPPKTWQEAFFALTLCLENDVSQHQNVLFFDEVPWLATARSKFLNALSFFWNTWAVQHKVIVVLCGSAASWMLQKLINDKGGLHNRITKRIELKPFTLRETEDFLKSRHINLDRYQTAMLYMALGGIPHYLNEVTKGKSAHQNIQDVCFSPGGTLQSEFSRLYPALFDNPEHHIAVVRALAAKPTGMGRPEILAAVGIPDGGAFSLCLEELEASGFISSYFSFGRKRKDMVYRLTDEYSLFFLKFIATRPNLDEHIWTNLSQTQSYKAWVGYAFESLCLKHIVQIKKALGISGVYSESSAFYRSAQAGTEGVQVDLLIDRQDNVINLFEIKFHSEPYVLTKSAADGLRRKSALFRHYSQSSKHIFLNLLSPRGLIENEHSLGLIDQALDIDALFTH